MPSNLQSRLNRDQIATFAGGCFWCTEATKKRVTHVEIRIIRRKVTGVTYKSLCERVLLFLERGAVFLTLALTDFFFIAIHIVKQNKKHFVKL